MLASGEHRDLSRAQVQLPERRRVPRSRSEHDRTAVRQPAHIPQERTLLRARDELHLPSTRRHEPHPSAHFTRRKRPRASWEPRPATSFSGSGPWRRRSSRVGPATSSMTRKSVPSAVSKSKRRRRGRASRRGRGVPRPCPRPRDAPRFGSGRACGQSRRDLPSLTQERPQPLASLSAPGDGWRGSQRVYDGNIPA